MKKFQGNLRRKKFYSEVYNLFGKYKVYIFLPADHMIIKRGKSFTKINIQETRQCSWGRRSNLQDVALAVDALIWASLFENNSDVKHHYAE